MPDVRLELEAAIAGAERDGNVMLRLRDRECGPAAVAGFVAKLATAAECVVLAGYRKDWRPADAVAPAWAEALDACVEHGEGLGVIPSAQAASPALAGFWNEGSFFGERPAPNKPRPQYHPGLAVIQMPPARLADFPFETWASPLVAFAAGLAKRRRRGYFAPALALVDRDIAAGSDRLSLLYQDPAWLTAVGSAAALKTALTALHARMRTP